MIREMISFTFRNRTQQDAFHAVLQGMHKDMPLLDKLRVALQAKTGVLLSADEVREIVRAMVKQ